MGCWGKKGFFGLLPYATISLLLLLSFPLTVLASTYKDPGPVYALNLEITGYNKTSSNSFVVQMLFHGSALIFVKPVNSSFTEVDVRLVGVVSPGIEVESMSKGWMTFCHGRFPELNCNVALVRLNTSNFSRFAERKVNVTLRYLVMNKYNYAWEVGSGRFIGFFPFYSVPDARMYTGKEPPKYVYLNRTVVMGGTIINEVTGTWGSVPESLVLKDDSGRNVTLTTLFFSDNGSGFLDVNVIHHYVVFVDGVFVLPFKELGGVFVGTYPYVIISGSLDPHYVDYVKSIDDYPEEVSVVTWRWVETVAAVTVGAVACGASAAYLAYRRRRRSGK